MAVWPPGEVEALQGLMDALPSTHDPGCLMVAPHSRPGHYGPLHLIALTLCQEGKKGHQGQTMSLAHTTELSSCRAGSWVRAH